VQDSEGSRWVGKNSKAKKKNNNNKLINLKN
jgi:hypothetical protein